MYHVKLDDAARQELHLRAHHKQVAPRTRDRLEMVRLSDRGWSIPKIAQHLGQHEQTVRFWIKRFLLQGFCGLDDLPHTGQQSAITAQILGQVRSWIEKADRTWNAHQVAAEVERVYGIKRSYAQWRRLLKKEQMSYKRTSRSLRHKQQTDQKASKQTQLQALEKRGSPAR
jgi:transposase